MRGTIAMLNNPQCYARTEKTLQIAAKRVTKLVGPLSMCANRWPVEGQDAVRTKLETANEGEKLQEMQKPCKC